MPTLIDSHCHLSFEPLCDDLDGVFERAALASVDRVVVPAYDLESWQTVTSIARRDRVYPAFGLHPWRADEDLDLRGLRSVLVEQKAVAVGEIGLDFKVETPGRERQLEVFSAQVELAVELDLPVILHCRGAFEELLEVLKRARFPVRGVMHAYSRGPELARRIVDTGLYLGFGGAITRHRARRARRSAVVVPMDRIVLETDAPSIGLDGVGPVDTEPRHVREVATALAKLRDATIDEIARQSTANAVALFGL